MTQTRLYSTQTHRNCVGFMSCSRVVLNFVSPKFWACRGLEVWGNRVVLVFLNFMFLLLILNVVKGFWPNLEAFTNLLLNKRVMRP